MSSRMGAARVLKPLLSERERCGHLGGPIVTTVWRTWWHRSCRPDELNAGAQ